MKGIAQELRDMAWHKRHLEKRAKRKLIRALHLAESRMPKMIRKPVAPPELTFLPFFLAALHKGSRFWIGPR